MKHQIKHINGSVLFECEIPNDTESGLMMRAALEKATASDANLSGADLSGADLRGADLRDADLSGADLRGADLRDADLSGADLSGADLRGADLRGADLARWHFGASGCLDAPDYLPIGSCVKDCMGVYPADIRRAA